jgi:hypothetical protein
MKTTINQGRPTMLGTNDVQVNPRGSETNQLQPVAVSLSGAEPAIDARQITNDSLGGWAVWAVVFAILSITIVGGAIGGLVAGIISAPVTSALPVRADGRKIPAELSVLLIVVAFLIFVFGHAALLSR